MFDFTTVAAISATFLLAGIVKGAIGLGLAPVSLGLLVAILDLHTAMVLLVVPSFAANAWQAATGGNGRAILRKTWPFLVAATASVGFGVAALTRFDVGLLSALLGALLCGYAALNLLGIRFHLSAPAQVWAGPLLGAANGLLTGMTGSFVVPGVMYLQAICLPRDMLIQAMGLLFIVSTVALTVALQGNDLITPKLGLASASAVVPVFIGVLLGQRLRRSLPEQRFRKVFFISILMLGAYIVAMSAGEQAG